MTSHWVLRARKVSGLYRMGSPMWRTRGLLVLVVLVVAVVNLEGDREGRWTGMMGALGEVEELRVGEWEWGVDAGTGVLVGSAMGR